MPPPMKTVDTRGPLPYSPLVPAVEAICQARPGEEIEILLGDLAAFNDLKEYLVERGIGFREVYDEDVMALEFVR